MDDASTGRFQMFRPVLACLAALSTLGTALAAQDATIPVAPGMQVRVNRAGGQPVVGEVVSVSPEALVISRGPGDTVSLPRVSVGQLEVAAGTKSNASRGAGRGLVIGGIVGGVLGAVAYGSWSDNYYFTCDPTCVAAGMVGGAILGAGIGALVGAASRSPRWTPAALPVLNVQPGQAEGATVSLGVHLRF
jgi:hypothetical protein